MPMRGGTWSAAVERFAVARAAGRATADDLLALADAAWWLGDVELSIDAGEESYRRFLFGDVPVCARSPSTAGFTTVRRAAESPLTSSSRPNRRECRS